MTKTILVLALLLPTFFLGTRYAQSQRTPSAETGPAVANELRAHKFVLVDNDGNTRADLACSGDGSTARLWIGRPDQGNSILLGIDPSGTARIVLARNGVWRTELGLDPNGQALLLMRADNKQRRITAQVNPEGDARLQIGDRQKRVITLAADRLGSAIDINGKNKRPLFLLHADEEDSTLMLFDREGRAHYFLASKSREWQHETMPTTNKTVPGHDKDEQDE